MLGLGLGVTGASSVRMSFTAYQKDGVAPTLILNPAGNMFAKDPEGWALSYAVEGVMPAAILNFTAQIYGRS
ncbi:hypothetical protein [Phaeovulum sp. W22_SRMD_FR3]|uniref:hypothetical protein n=1 Tax=Phaeovulum sp. W22_SRMD_FR3 TaxID=3240274 RepID=UPI003F98FBF1